MQVAIRRLIIVSAISLFGASAGIALGNFVAAGPKATGMEELANYNSSFDTSVAQGRSAEAESGFAGRAGPNHYDCKGCDASLYNDVVPGDSAALTEPLPPYQAEEPAEPALRSDASGSAPRRGAAPGQAAPVAYLATPVLPAVTPASAAPPAVAQTVAAQTVVAQ